MTQRDVTLHCLLHTAQAGASADFRQGIVSRAPESSSHQRRIPGVCDLGVNPKRRSIKHDKIDRRLVFRSLCTAYVWVLGRSVDPTAYACATKIVFRYSTSVVTAAGVESGSPGAKSTIHPLPKNIQSPPNFLFNNQWYGRVLLSGAGCEESWGSLSAPQWWPRAV